MDSTTNAKVNALERRLNDAEGRIKNLTQTVADQQEAIASLLELSNGLTSKYDEITDSVNRLYFQLIRDHMGFQGKILKP